MVTARELIAEAERRGARFEVVGDTLKSAPRSALDDDLRRLIGEHKAAVIAELQRREVLVEAAQLLRIGRWPPVIGVCAFHVGKPGHQCRRCNASWIEHYPS